MSRGSTSICDWLSRDETLQVWLMNTYEMATPTDPLTDLVVELVVSDGDGVQYVRRPITREEVLDLATRLLSSLRSHAWPDPPSPLVNPT